MPTSPLFNWRVWAIMGITIMLAASHWKAYKMGEATVAVEWAADKLSQADQTNQLQAETARTTINLQADADKTRKTKDAKITKLNADLTIALNGLRDLPSRPGEGDLPSPTGAAAGCYPAQLYREDASVAVQLAGEADQLRISLGACYASHADARRALSTD